ncbi:MAG TPA: carboxypeptidase regulatory-like domain-containing protein [Kofleriaceae bacterium]|nr:carboxypeptidase regulatory-like domain-containing protein [Kofleriaceae bacterium]
MNKRTAIGLVILLGLGAAARWLTRSEPAVPPPTAAGPRPTTPTRPARSAAPLPALEAPDGDGIDGRVLDAATQQGVPDAKLVFRGDGGDAAFTTRSDGAFELTPRAAGDLVLATIVAPGYAPYSPVRAGTRLTLARGRAVHGVTLLIERVTASRRLAAPFDATITGHVRDTAGAPVAGAVVRAAPAIRAPVGFVFATTGADGAFALAGVDRGAYTVSAEADDRVRAVRADVTGDSHDVELVVDAGAPLAGHVVDRDGNPVPRFALLVQAATGVTRQVVTRRDLIDPDGRFALRIAPGDYELIASAPGFARSAPLRVTAAATGVRIVLGGGATLRGRVVAGDDQAPIGGATIKLWGNSVGPDGEVPYAATRDDGSFELAGIPGGPVEIMVHAEGYRGRLEGAMFARDGAALGPITLELTRLSAGVPKGIDTIGIGISLTIDGDALAVVRVMPGSSARDAGVVFGDQVVAVDGIAVTQLGFEGALARMRGMPGSSVTLTLRRDGQLVQLAVERRLLHG